MAEFQQFQYGNVVFPLGSQAKGADLGAVCDPSLAKLIDYLSFCVDRYLGTALIGAVSAGNPPITKNVMRTISVDPIVHVAKSEQVRFPLFGMWRKRSTFNQRTLNWNQDMGRVGWGYMLPPMTLEQGEKFSHVLHAVALIVDHSLYQGFDPAYRDGERVIGGNNIEKARLLEANYEPYRIGDLTDTHFHSVFGEIELDEKVMAYTAGLPPLTGAGIAITDESVQPGNPVEIIQANTTP